MTSDDNNPELQPDFSHNEVASRKLADAQPVSAEELRQLAFQQMEDGFSIVDANGLHVDVNPALCAMTGFSKDELIGSSPELFYWPPEERQKIQIAFSKTLQGELSECESIFVRKSGERFPVLVVPFAIRDTSGAASFFGATVKDITHRVKIETALRESEVRFRTLFESAGDAIVILDENRIVDCNNQTPALYGYSREKILSTPTTDFFPPTQPDGKNSREFFDEMVEASRSGGPQLFEWTGRNVDGTPIYTEVTLATFTLDNKHYIQSIARDITQRKKMEAALIDLNNTLEDRVLQRTDELERAYAELLQRNVHFRELAKRLTNAEEKERKRIARLLHDNHQQLLVAAKFQLEVVLHDSHDSGANSTMRQVLEILDQAIEITRSLTMELSPPILYGSGLVDAIQWLARWMQEHHQLEVTVQGSLPYSPISTDISSVILRSARELLFNVIKHSGARHASVNIALVEQGILMTVTDEGGGFNVANTLESGSSYGLFSIEEQLNTLGGRLDISSAPRRGTTCTVSVPMATSGVSYSEVPPVLDSIAVETAYTLPTSRGPIRVLVADDHTVARNALVQILSLAEDFDVVGEAIDGVDAVEKARMLKPEVIVMDVSMPRLNGVEATRRILTEFSEIKVIGLSMHNKEEIESQMLAAGAKSYLHKLIPVEELFTTIRRVMNENAAGVH